MIDQIILKLISCRPHSIYVVAIDAVGQQGKNCLLGYPIAIFDAVQPGLIVLKETPIFQKGFFALLDPILNCS